LGIPLGLPLPGSKRPEKQSSSGIGSLIDGRVKECVAQGGIEDAVGLRNHKVAPYTLDFDLS
jgi:hypothetical protein